MMKKTNTILTVLFACSLLACQADMDSNQHSKTDFSQHIITEDTADPELIKKQVEKFQSQFKSQETLQSKLKSQEKLRAALKNNCDQKQDDVACETLATKLVEETVALNLLRGIVTCDSDEECHEYTVKIAEKTGALDYFKKAYQYTINNCKQNRLVSCASAYGAYENLFAFSLSNDDKKQLLQDIAAVRQATQKACLSGNSPDSCKFDLVKLYQEEEYLTGDDLTFIQLVKQLQESDDKKWRTNKQLTQLASKLCDNNHPYACQLLGNSAPENSQTATQYYQKSCDLGVGESCFNVAYNLRVGEKNKKNDELQMKSYEKACNYGWMIGGTEPCAYAFYGYHCGLSVPKDTTKAKKYFTTACERGYWNLSGKQCDKDYQQMITTLDDAACKEMKEIQ